MGYINAVKIATTPHRGSHNDYFKYILDGYNVLAQVGNSRFKILWG